MIPRVLVGCPTSSHKRYCLKEYVAGLKRLTYPAKDVLLASNSQDGYVDEIKALGIPAVQGPWSEGARKRIAESRDILREKALADGYDYFLSLEQDVIPPADIIERLIACNKPIVSAVYFKTYDVMHNGQKVGTTIMPLLWTAKKENPDLVEQMPPDVLNTNALVPVIACGVGCVLIHRSVLEKVSFRLKEGTRGFDDMVFCEDARLAGFEICADTSIRCEHLERSWGGIQK